MEQEKFFKVLAAIVIIVALAWLTVYYLAQRQAGGVPAPDASGRVLGDADRAKLLESLRSKAPAISASDRQKLLESLRSAKPVAPATDSEREKLLQSLKTN